MRFRSRASLYLTLATAALSLGAALSVASVVEEGDVHLSEARLKYVMESVAAAAERGLGFGVPLRELTNVQRSLEKAVADNGEIVAGEIFDDNGVSLLSTERGAVGGKVPPEWLAAAAARNDRGDWIVRNRDFTVVGTPLLNDFGVPAGQVAFVALSDALSEHTALAGGFAPRGYLVALLVTLAAGLLTYAMLGRAEKRIEELAAELTPHGRMHESDDPELAGALVAAAATMRRADAIASAALDDLNRIDAEI